MNKGIQLVKERAGTQTNLARLITKHTGKPITQQAVQKWFSNGEVPLKRVNDVASVLRLEREQIRPDFFTGSSMSKTSPKHSPGGEDEQEINRSDA